MRFCKGRWRLSHGQAGEGSAATYKSLAHLLAPRACQKRFPFLKLTLYLCHVKLPLDVGHQDSRHGTAVCTRIAGSESLKLVDDLKGIRHGNQIECLPWRPPTKAEVTYSLPRSSWVSLVGGKEGHEQKHYRWSSHAALITSSKPLSHRNFKGTGSSRVRKTASRKRQTRHSMQGRGGNTNQVLGPRETRFTKIGAKLTHFVCFVCDK